jgi:hypothetical protein
MCNIGSSGGGQSMCKGQTAAGQRCGTLAKSQDKHCHLCMYTAHLPVGGIVSSPVMDKGSRQQGRAEGHKERQFSGAYMAMHATCYLLLDVCVIVRTSELHSAQHQGKWSD